MRIETSAGELVKVARQVLPAVTGRSTLPILNHLLFHSNETGNLVIDGNDMEIWISVTAPHIRATSGSFTVDARLFTNLLSKFSATDAITLDSDDKGGCVVKSGKRKYVLAGLPADQYPQVPVSVGDKICVEMPEATLLRLIKETIYAVSVDDARAILKGVYFCENGGNMHCVATDTHRLAISNSGVECDATLKAILPSGFASTVASALSDGETLVRIVFDARSAIFTIGDLTINCRLTEGHYPNYARVIPSVHTTEVTFNREEMQAAISRLNLIAKDGVNRIVWDVNGDGIALRTEAMGNDGDEFVDAISFTGEPFRSALNGKYAAECFAAYECDVVRIRMSEPLKPVLIDDNDSDKMQYSIMMPMQIVGNE